MHPPMLGYWSRREVTWGFVGRKLGEWGLSKLGGEVSPQTLGAEGNSKSWLVCIWYMNHGDRVYWDLTPTK